MLSSFKRSEERPLRIVQLITGSDTLGGAQTHVRDLSEGLIARGQDCTVLTGPPEGLFQRQLRDRDIPVEILTGLRKSVSIVQDPIAFVQILAALRRLKPDIIAVHTAKAGFLGRFAGRALDVPCVFTPHGWSFLDRVNQRVSRGFWVLEKVCAIFGGTAIAVCNREKKTAIETNLLDHERIQVVHNGIPDSNLLADPARGPVVITMVARFQAQKDHATLLRAMARLKDLSWSLRLAGAGPLLPEIKALCNLLGLADRVEFLGEHPNPERLLAESKVLVLSTLWEAFPIVILEGMRAGLPIVATDVGGVCEAILDEANGLLVPPSREDLLADALRRLLENAQLRTELGGNARTIFRSHFTADHMIDKTLHLYSSQVLHSKTVTTDGRFRKLLRKRGSPVSGVNPKSETAS